MRKCDIAQIEKVQRSFTKTICQPNCSYRQRCISLKLQPLWLRRIRLNLVFLFPLKYNLAYSSNGPLSFSESKGYSLQNGEFTFPTHFSRTTFRSKFFLPKYTALWNRLPVTIRQCSKLYAFRRLLENFLTPESMHLHLNLPHLIDNLYEEGVSGY